MVRHVDALIRPMVIPCYAPVADRVPELALVIERYATYRWHGKAVGVSKWISLPVAAQSEAALQFRDDRLDLGQFPWMCVHGCERAKVPISLRFTALMLLLVFLGHGIQESTQWQCHRPSECAQTRCLR
jgi:hypothetical protein